MTNHPVIDYAEPIASLLNLGDTGGLEPKDWPDYPARFGLDPRHVPELIRMACDHGFHDADDPLFWAPVHAWRTLAQLRAEEAIAPLLTLANAIGNEQEAVREDIPVVLGLIGPAALGPVGAFLDDPATNPEVLSIGTNAAQKIAERHPACRDEAVGILTRMLGRHAGLDPILNGDIVGALMDLKAVDSIDAIRAAFAADTVDPLIAGDLEDAEIALGLRTQRTRPRSKTLLGEWLDRVAAKGFDRDHQEPRHVAKIGRNEPCPCGSGKKYKKCCMA